MSKSPYVRMMLPVSIRCKNCGAYIYKGTKFNSRKEGCIGDTHLGLQVLRFYFKCSGCYGEIVMKSDPQNNDYVIEFGATRNCESWGAAGEAMDSTKCERKTEKTGNAMKALENHTCNAKRGMDIMACLDEMRVMSKTRTWVGSGRMLEALRKARNAEES